MKCPICGKDVELINRQVGTTEEGEPIFNEYAVCRSCRKQWNLDKQRAKKRAAQKAAAVHKNESDTQPKAPAKPDVKAKADPKPEAKPKTDPKPEIKPKADPKPEETPAERSPHSKTTSNPRKESSASESLVSSSGKKPVKRRSETEKQTSSDSKRYGNIPPEQVRSKRERAVRKGYEDMLATDPGKKPSRKKSVDNERKISQKTDPKPETVDYDDYDDYEESKGRFRPARIILGILSLLGFGFFIYKGFITGLNDVSAGNDSATGTAYIILALCMLIAALLYFIMQKKSTVFAFLLPMLFYLGSAGFAFLKRGDDLQMLICAIVSAVLALISLILAITSRGVDDYDEDYDDTDEDDNDEEDYDDDDDDYDED